MRLITALSVSAVAFAVAISAHPASAATITQISYTVVGGSFGAFGEETNATGAITGGSVTVTLPGPSGVSTPPSWSCFSAYGGCGTAAIVLNGPSGYIKATGLPASWAWVSAGSASFSQGLSLPSMFSGASAPGTLVPVNAWNVSAAGGSGSGVINWTWIKTSTFGWKNYPVHSFQIGQEVRTMIPEPSTASLLALGMGLLGLMGTGLLNQFRRHR